MDNRLQKLSDMEKRIEEIASILQTPGEHNSKELESLLLETSMMFSEAETLLALRKADVLSNLLENNHLMSGNEQKIFTEAKSVREAKLARNIEQISRALSLIIANRKRL